MKPVRVDSLQVKLFFKLHDEFNNVEGVCSECLEQRWFVGDLIAFDTKVICNNLDDTVPTFFGLLDIE